MLVGWFGTKQGGFILGLDPLFQGLKNSVLGSAQGYPGSDKSLLKCSFSLLDLLKSWHGGVTVILLSDREYFDRVGGTERELNSELSCE